jgi:hypothetical protein
MKKYSLHYLLSKQPESVKKNKYFKLMRDYYNSSDALKNLIISNKFYSILNKSKIIPEKIGLFYQVYKIPKNPFFPLFLKIKKEYLEKQKKNKREQIQYKLKKMKKLPEQIQDYLKEFAKYEKNLNKKNACPVWLKIIFPGSKKQADSLILLKKDDWIKIFNLYINQLKRKYLNFNENQFNNLTSLFILELPVNNTSLDIIKLQYRKLSKSYHPDSGGNSKDFNMLQNAYKSLIIS